MSGSRGFTLLVIVTLLFVAAAVSTLDERALTVGAATDAREPWWPGMLERVNDVARIEVRGADAEIDLAREGGTWVVEQLHGFPADAEQVKALVMGLARATRVQVRTGLPERQQLLGLEWPPATGGSSAPTDAPPGSAAAPASEALQVRFADAAGGELARVLIGRAEFSGPRRQRVNARRADDDQCWLVDELPRPGATPLVWIDPTLLALPEARVQRLRLTPVDGEPVEVERSDATTAQATGRDFELGTPPEGREIAAFTRLSAAARALENVRLDDVLPGRAPADLSWAHARFETTDGLVIEARVARVGENTMLELQVEATGAADEAARAEAGRWTALWSGRHFLVPTWFHARIDQALEDFLEPLPEPEPEPELDASPGIEPPLEAEAPLEGDAGG